MCTLYHISALVCISPGYSSSPCRIEIGCIVSTVIIIYKCRTRFSYTVIHNCWHWHGHVSTTNSRIIVYNHIGRTSNSRSFVIHYCNRKLTSRGFVRCIIICSSKFNNSITYREITSGWWTHGLSNCNASAFRIYSYCIGKGNLSSTNTRIGVSHDIHRTVNKWWCKWYVRNIIVEGRPARSISTRSNYSFCAIYVLHSLGMTTSIGWHRSSMDLDQVTTFIQLCMSCDLIT